MLLQDSIDRALELTRELQAGLEDDRADAWDEVLALRADAMVRFQDAHRRADANTLAACRLSLESLASADRELQRLAEVALAVAAADFHDQLGAAPTGASAYDTDPLQGAVNRRA